MTKPLESTLAKPKKCPTDGVHLYDNDFFILISSNDCKRGFRLTTS